MGREATCRCTWGEENADCKVLLEGAELIVRQGTRRRIPLTTITDLSTRGEDLLFCMGADRVAIHLGSELAQRWAKAMATPPPSLSHKLGISSITRLRILGNVHSKELETAVAEAGDRSGIDAGLVLICGDSQAEILSWARPSTAKDIKGTSAPRHCFARRRFPPAIGPQPGNHRRRI